MPELPEVETIARVLREGVSAKAPALLGRTIQSVDVLWPREISNLTPRAFTKRIAGSQVQTVSRHGKYLLIELRAVEQRSVLANRKSKIQNPKCLTMLVHLKMSGRLDVVSQVEAYSKHARVVWLLDDGLALRFDDARKFGRVWLTDDPSTVTGKLGPDALGVTLDVFQSRLFSRRGALKLLLLDQTFIAGVGNIYADESLFLARLHPRRITSSLTAEDVARLHAAIQHVLSAGIAANGASFDWVYPGGNFQNSFNVYGMTGKACVCCGQPIERILVGQRSTHFCFVCQPLLA